MCIIRKPSDLPAASHQGVHQVLTQRKAELKLSPKADHSDIGEFIIVESGDAIADLEDKSGCLICTDIFGESHYGDPDFVPGFEWL